MQIIRLFTALALAALVLFGSNLAPRVALATDLVAPISLEALEDTLLDLTNADRAAQGLAPVERDERLVDIARERAASELGRTSLSHYDVDGGLIFARLLDGALVPYLLAGENLARAADVDLVTVARVQASLMRSPLHRQNILEPSFNRLAVGVARSEAGTVTFAAIFRAAP